MLEGILPNVASRLRIFLSYASEHHRIAEELAQTLKNSGHEVFFDKDTLPAGEDFNERIRAGIRRSDRFVFLISRSSLQEGRFTLSELQFAKERWPAPSGKVFPVLLDKTIKPEELPVYLRSVQALSIQGNATAEIANEIDKTRRTRSGVWGALALLVMAVGAAAFGVSRLPSGKVAVDFVPPLRVDFRPTLAPPDRGGQGDAWLRSPLTVSALQFAYQNNSDQRTVQVEPEKVELKIDQEVYGFEYRYQINLINGCEGGWHCVKQPGPVAVRNIEAGNGESFQSLFRIFPNEKLSWEQFADKLAVAQSVSVYFTPRVEAAGKPLPTQVRHECVLDVAKFNSAIAETRQARGRIPIFMQQVCTYK